MLIAAVKTDDWQNVIRMVNQWGDHPQIKEEVAALAISVQHHGDQGYGLCGFKLP